MNASPPLIRAGLFIACLLPSTLRSEDTDNDGLNDLWQQRFGIPSFTGSADPDGDGRINLVESRNFSNPNKPDTNPLGIVMIRDLNPVDGLHDPWQAQFGITAAQKWDDPDGDGRTNFEESISKSDPFVADAPYSLLGTLTPAVERPGPDSFIARVPDSAQGRRYILEVSDTLLPGSWVTATMVSNGSPYQWGTGDELSGEALTGSSPRKFFRWKIDDPDSDSDFVPDWMEMQMGTQVNNADSDGDGDSDGYEWMEGTDANDAADGTKAKGYEKGLMEAPVTFLGYYKAATNRWYGGNLTQSDVQWSGSAPQSSGTEKYWGFSPRWSDKLGGLGYPDNSGGGAVPWRDYGSICVRAYTSIAVNEGGQAGYASVQYVQARLGSFPQMTSQPWDVTRNRLALVHDRNFSGSSPSYSQVQMLPMRIPKGANVSDPILMEPADEANKYKEHAILSPAVRDFDGAIDLNGRVDEVIEPWIMIPAGGTRQVQLDGGQGDGGHRWMYRFQGVIPVGLGVEGSAVRTQPNPYNTISLHSPAGETGFVGTIHAGVSRGDEGEAIYAENQPLMRCLALPEARLSVVVHPITLLAADGSVIAEPENCPTAPQLKAYLDTILKQQANLESDVTVLPPVALNWDVGVQVPGSDTSGADAATRLNQRLDVLDAPSNATDPRTGVEYIVSEDEKKMFGKSMEETKILTATPPDLSKEVNVYFVAAPGGLQHTHFYPPLHPLRRTPQHMHISEDGVLGYAGRALPSNGGVIWVYDFEYVPTMPSLGRPAHKWAILHEIVHYAGRVGHATDGGDPNKFTAENHQPNSDNERRVMTGRLGPKRATSPSKLIKFEWERLNRKLGPRGLNN